MVGVASSNLVATTKIQKPSLFQAGLFLIRTQGLTKAFSGIREQAHSYNQKPKDQASIPRNEATALRLLAINLQHQPCTSEPARDHSNQTESQCGYSPMLSTKPARKGFATI